MPNSEIVKGYEFEKGRYVVVSEEDFDKVRPESTRVIDLVQFADESSIDPMYVDRTYYLAPDGAMAADAFAVMRDGMKGKVGIGKLALYGREYLVAVQPHERGIVMYTLHHAAEIRSIDAVEELNSVPAKVKPEEIKLAQQVIETFEGPLDLADYKDEYQEGLQRIIDAKIAGEEIVAPSVEAPPKVVNLMDALKKSLDAVSTGKKKTGEGRSDQAGGATAKVSDAEAQARVERGCSVSDRARAFDPSQADAAARHRAPSDRRASRAASARRTRESQSPTES